MSKATKPKVWVLTYEVNDYDQHGEYFLAVFEKKPTYEQVVDFLSDNYRNVGTLVKAVFRLVDSGGGRIHNEDTWYHLRAVEYGRKLDPK